jgi:hypothetical protein
MFGGCFTTGREEWRMDNAECRSEHKNVTGVSFSIIHSPFSIIKKPFTTGHFL